MQLHSEAVSLMVLLCFWMNTGQAIIRTSELTNRLSDSLLRLRRARGNQHTDCNYHVRDISDEIARVCMDAPELQMPKVGNILSILYAQYGNRNPSSNYEHDVEEYMPDLDETIAAQNILREQAKNTALEDKTDVNVEKYYAYTAQINYVREYREMLRAVKRFTWEMVPNITLAYQENAYKPLKRCFYVHKTRKAKKSQVEDKCIDMNMLPLMVVNLETEQFVNNLLSTNDSLKYEEFWLATTKHGSEVRYNVGHGGTKLVHNSYTGQLSVANHGIYVEPRIGGTTLRWQTDAIHNDLRRYICMYFRMGTQVFRIPDINEELNYILESHYYIPTP